MTEEEKDKLIQTLSEDLQKLSSAYSQLLEKVAAQFVIRGSEYIERYTIFFAEEKIPPEPHINAIRITMKPIQTHFYSCMPLSNVNGESGEIIKKLVIQKLSDSIATKIYDMIIDERKQSNGNQV